MHKYDSIMTIFFTLGTPILSNNARFLYMYQSINISVINFQKVILFSHVVQINVIFLHEKKSNTMTINEYLV